MTTQTPAPNPMYPAEAEYAAAHEARNQLAAAVAEVNAAVDQHGAIAANGDDARRIGNLLLNAVNAAGKLAKAEDTAANAFALAMFLKDQAANG